MAADSEPGAPRLTIVFFNLDPPESHRASAPGFILHPEAITEFGSGAPVAHYREERWESGGRRFLRVELEHPVMLSFGSDERQALAQGPYTTARLFDGILLAGQTPIASLHEKKGWFCGTDGALWKWVRIEPLPLQRASTDAQAPAVPLPADELIPLAAAAIEAYWGPIAAQPTQAEPHLPDPLLDALARAISKAAPIYVQEGGAVRLVTPAELVYAAFRRGASVLVTADGQEHGPLLVRRADLEAAIAILKAAIPTFPP